MDDRGRVLESIIAHKATSMVVTQGGLADVPAEDPDAPALANHEVLELQACHPRFFATHRYIVYAKLISVLPRGGVPYPVETASAAG